MDYSHLDYATKACGCLPEAQPDVMQRLMRQFPGDVTPEEIGVALVALRKSAPHLYPPTAAPAPAPATDGVPQGMPPELWRSMTPESKLAWHRTHTPQPVPVKRRPVPLTLTAEQVQVLAELSPIPRTTLYRQWQADAQKGT